MQDISRDIHQDSEGGERIGVYYPLFYYARLEIQTMSPVLRINTPDELTEFLNTKEKVFFLIREQDYLEEIRKRSFKVLSTRKLRKKSKLKLKEAWELYREKGLTGATAGNFETVVLLTNQ